MCLIELLGNSIVTLHGGSSCINNLETHLSVNVSFTLHPPLQLNTTIKHMTQTVSFFCAIITGG